MYCPFISQRNYVCSSNCALAIDAGNDYCCSIYKLAALKEKELELKEKELKLKEIELNNKKD